MKKLLTAMAAVSALAAAAPSFAQPYVGDRADHIADRIEMGVRSGSLTLGEADRLRARLRDVERTEARYRYDGMSDWEARDLERRYDGLSADVRFQRHDNQYRYEHRDDWRY